MVHLKMSLDLHTFDYIFHTLFERSYFEHFFSSLSILKHAAKDKFHLAHRPVAPIADYDVFFAGQDDLQIATNGFCNRLPLGPAAERINAQHVITVLHCATVQCSAMHCVVQCTVVQFSLVHCAVLC